MAWHNLIPLRWNRTSKSNRTPLATGALVACPVDIRKQINTSTDPFIPHHQHSELPPRANAHSNMAKAKGVVYQPFHSSNDPDPTPPPVPPKPPSRRRSISNRARQLFGLGSGDNAAGQRRSVDGVGTNMRRMWSRSGSTPPDTRNRDHRLQDGDTIFSPVSANASRAYAEERANKMLGFGRNEGQIQAHFRVSSEVDLSGRPLRDDKDRGRSRHRDATRSSPAPPAPPPKPGFSPSSPTKSPVIPPRPTAKPMEPTARKLRKPVPQERRPKILFYHKTEPYYGFTNFSPHPVDYRGKRYPTSEHLFQSFKVGLQLGHIICPH